MLVYTRVCLVNQNGTSSMNVDLFPNAKPLGFIYMFSSLRVRSIGPTNIGGLSSNNWDVAGDVIFSFFLGSFYMAISNLLERMVQ